MTVSANPVPDFQRDQILTAGIRMVGILGPHVEPTAEQLESAAFHFNMALEDLQSEGIVLTTIERTTLALTSSTAEYTLPSDTIDVMVESNNIIGSVYGASSTAETATTAMSRGEWMAIATKNTLSGYPSRCYVEKQASVKLVFWPVPNGDLTFRYSRVRLLRAGDTGAVTMDLKRTWTAFLTYSVAAGAALDNSQAEKATMFKAWAEDKRERCKAGDSQHGSLRLRVGQNGRNW